MDKILLIQELRASCQDDWGRRHGIGRRYRTGRAAGGRRCLPDTWLYLPVRLRRKRWTVAAEIHAFEKNVLKGGIAAAWRIWLLTRNNYSRNILCMRYRCREERGGQRKSKYACHHFTGGHRPCRRIVALMCTRLGQREEKVPQGTAGLAQQVQEDSGIGK